MINHSKPILSEKEMNYLENWSEMIYKEMIFDSDYCDWDWGKSSFDKRLLNRGNYAIIIEDTENNVFGTFIHKSFDHYTHKINGCYNSILTDSTSFTFSLRSNGRLETPMKFLTKLSEKQRTILIENEMSEVLISIGMDDIMIPKKILSTIGFCSENSYDYQGYKNVFVGKTGNDEKFTTKRIQVYQMFETEELKKSNEEKTRLIISKEIKEMKEYSHPIVSEQEMKQIEEWNGVTFEEIIFDSNYCDWSIETSTLEHHLLKKEKFVVIIEDEERNIFGGYVDRKIEHFKQWSNKQKMYTMYGDSKTIIFCLKSSYFSQPTKYDIKTEKSMEALFIYSKNHHTLFTLGYKDIVIMKKENSDSCYCESECFKYNDSENLLGKKEKRQTKISVKRIQIYQMKEIEEQKKMKQQQELLNNELSEKQYINEKHQLKEIKNKIMNEYQLQIKQLEDWTGLKSKEIVFDSTYCNWEIYSSTFEKHIWNKNKLAFIVENEKGIRYGGFLYATIDKTTYFQNETDSYECIVDPQSFVFTFMNDNPMKFEMKETHKNNSTFFICTNKDYPLFAFGNYRCCYEIWVGKKNIDGFCKQKNLSNYDYRNVEKAIVGCERDDDDGEFKINRVVVIQFD